MAHFKTSNLGRGVKGPKYRQNVRKVFFPLNHAGVTGLQEIDEADTPDEHQILRNETLRWYKFAGWNTHTPIAVPRVFWKIIREDVIPASHGVPKQSPARQIVEVELKHRLRLWLPSIVVMNIHFPRKGPALVDERADCMRKLKERVALNYDAGKTVLITSDANGMNVLDVHPKARRIGGEGIDWIVLVQNPSGCQFLVDHKYEIDTSIDAHNAHGVLCWLYRPGLRNH